MIYDLAGRNFSGQVESWDEKVIAATPAMKWAINKPIREVLDWLEHRDIKWRLTNHRKSALCERTMNELNTAEQAKREHYADERLKRIQGHYGAV